MFGGLYWINPDSGATAYYGYTGSSGKDGNGTPITNSWNGQAFPSGESADIDQTQAVLTFYGVALDPAGSGPLVIQGIFNPSTIAQPATPQGGGAQIGNAHVTATTAYAVVFNNGLTFTNLTPQTSAQHSVVNQVAQLDPTFNAAKLSSGPNGWNCVPNGMSGAVFFFSCLSIGQDSPGWIFAFSPGDGNPAHAGQSGGPRMVGAISTFNTPGGSVASTQTSYSGRSLHAVSETGETGWIQVQANVYAAINTSNIASIPAASPSCATFGLAGNNNQCILLNINSYTAGGVTGYEPYFSTPQYQFTGAPGELRTAQLGDTACVAASTVSNCQWSGQSNELMTLVLKNYNGVQGAWVFQRNGYGSEKTISSGPVTLKWVSNQWSVPPGGTTENGSLAGYWNPLTGCGGAPDPHGNCMIEDTNNTGHGEWRDGGAAVATNVPAWSAPIWGWPTDYQNAIGTVPGIFSLPFANVTPFQSAAVNYTSANPPFAGVYGHPWGFDGGSHPNAAGAAASAYESIRAFDNTPVQGGGGDPTFTPVTGQLYVATPSLVTDPDDFFGSGSTVGINRKLMAQGNSCGSHPLIDISGPAAAISTDVSGSYTSCFARTNGECYAGSTAGQVYVNCPGVVWNYCSGSGIHGGTPLGVGNDICVGNIAEDANAVRQFTMDRTDFAGAYTRTLVTATSRLRMVYGFENNRLLPDNSWLLMRADFLEYQRSDMWMAKMLPYPPPDSVVRSTFVPVALTLKPPAGLDVNNAIVQFGYQEYGAPQRINCTARNDACIATTSAVTTGNQPFVFASENSAGAACSAGCTITIPAVSQRILYYRVAYRAANNAVLAAGPVVAVVVP